MGKDDYFKVLERTFLTYGDLKSVAVKDNGEDMISLCETGVFYSISDALPPSTGDSIYIREGLIERLRAAQGQVSDLFGGGRLEVVYGYRSLKIQTVKYDEIRKNLQAKFPDENVLNEAVHKFIAAPDVAGHPTGGAIDVRILDADGNVIDMGTNVHELVKDSNVFNPFISRDAWQNRQKLRIAMCAAGFAPFDGEWWHFSYGDREWASYYNKSNSIYNQIEFEALP